MNKLIFILVIIFVGCSHSKRKPIKNNPIDFYSNLKSSSDEIRASAKLKERVNHWIRVFSGDFKERFQQYLNNGAKYKTTVLSILREHHLPDELYYLPVIESGYNLNARSHAYAVGPWQFIKSTGESYGLEINRYVDERRDVLKSTQAAATHLRDLYNIFGSWELALSAYNAGANRVMGIIIKGSNRDFWKLSEQGILPEETMDYIPKFLAAVTIGNNPQKYGFVVERVAGNYQNKTSVFNVPSGVSLRKISQHTKVKYKFLKDLNPELVRNYIPKWYESYELRVPKGTDGKQFLASIAKIPKQRRVVTKSKPGFYKVKRGDTLSGIASRFNVKIGHLVKVNGLRNPSSIYIGQQLSLEDDFSGVYTVKKGDNLITISRLYGTTPKMVMRLNGLRSSQIYPGQKLRVSPRTSNFYVVKSGDTLWDIARENQMSVRDILSLNSLSSTKIFKGQKLIVSKL